MAKKFRVQRHAFRFDLGGGRIISYWAKVIPATKDVWLPLKAEHVSKSIALRGVGNTQACTMAVCAAANHDSFPHKVEGGYIDWFYSRAFVVSKLNKDGLPAECYEYSHSDNIAKMNDTQGGQKKLLAELRADGDRMIHLLPPQIHPSQKGKGAPQGRPEHAGKRTRIAAKGARLRFAFAQMGGVQQ